MYTLEFVIELTDKSTTFNIKKGCCRDLPPQLNTHGLRMMFGSEQTTLN